MAVVCAWTPPPAVAGTTHVTIDGADFHINGGPTYPGTTVEGLLLNSRMVNAAFDDENPATVGTWEYPDTNRWDPERNTNEFVAALPLYAAHGLKAVSVNLQGGNPVPGCSCNATHDWITTAFRSDGTLKASWMSRIDRIVTAADEHGIVVILGLFYHGQDQRVSDETAVKRAVDETVDWVLANGHENVLLEIAGESNHSLTSHSIVRSRVHELIARAQSRAGGRLAVSTGFTGGHVPSETVVGQSDYVILHGNGQTEESVRSMVDQVRQRDAWKADPKPIVFTEDSTKIANLEAAVGHGASWGYHDKGSNDYVTGFQTPPIKWALSTSAQRAFFDRVAEYAATRSGPSLAFSPSSLSLAADVDGAVITRTASLEASEDGSPAYAITDDASWLSLTADTGTVPAALTVSADPGGLAPGTYTGTATATASGYEAATLTVTLSVSGPSAYRLLVSQSSQRSSPSELDGAVVAGKVYVFTAPDTGVNDVRFYVDDPDRSGSPYRTEANAPYDLTGGSVSTANAYDTEKLSDGTHTVTAVLLESSGGEDVVHAVFQVRNTVPRLVLDPGMVTLSAAEDDEPVSSGFTVRAGDGGSPAVAVSDDTGWLSVAPSGATAPAALTVTADPAGLAPGTYTGTATTTADGYTAASLVVSFTVGSSSPSTYRIVVSSSASRSAPSDLDGRTVSGPVYAFTTPDDGVARVRFYVDDPDRSGSAFRTEESAPFDLGGGSATVAKPFDTQKLADGPHTVTAVLEFSAGGSGIVHATFSVDN